MQQVADALRQAERILIITGAGLSADSGLPTYRGVGGLYNDRTEDGLPIETALSGPMLRLDPTLCWKYWLKSAAPASRRNPTPAMSLSPNCSGANLAAGC